MRHPSLNIKKFTIKENPGYRVRVESWECVAPKGLLTVDVIQESLNDKGEISSSSTYNFNMTRDEIKTFCEGLLSV